LGVCDRGCHCDHVVSRDMPVPLHEQLSAELRKQIRAGQLTSRVPSILSLAQQYEVSHRTASHALETLRDEGLIVAVRGLGYFVAEGAAGPAPKEGPEKA
jgi:DNA-binding GntR family transcriptional regulator